MEVCHHSSVDLIDFEISNGINEVEEIRKTTESNNKKLILSYHNFEFTPTNEKLIQLAVKAEELGADVAKIAVMPKSKEDVLRLLQVTKEIDELLSILVVTMSMGYFGCFISEIGWVCGYAMSVFCA